MKIISPTGEKLMFDGRFVEYKMPVPTEITIQGYTYQVVMVGNQCWINENLRADISADTYHYGNYGAYYTITEINEGIPQLLQSLGLDGWHVPTITETNALFDFVMSETGVTSRSNAGKYLMKTTESGAVDDRYGMSFVKNGSYDGRYGYITDDGYYVNMGEQSSNNTVFNRVAFNSSFFNQTGEATYRKYGTRLVYIYNEG